MASARLLLVTQQRFATDKCGKITVFIVSLSSTSYMRGVFVLVLLHKDNKLLSICRDFKSLDDFIIRQQTRYSASMPNMVTLVE